MSKNLYKLHIDFDNITMVTANGLGPDIPVKSRISAFTTHSFKTQLNGLLMFSCVTTHMEMLHKK